MPVLSVLRFLAPPASGGSPRIARRTVLRAAGALLLGAAILPGGAALAQTAWPARPVRLVVPFPPGGFSDVMGRILSQEMGKTLGQSVVVENRPGAGGNIGADIVAQSAGDGYTLVMGTIGTHAINASLFQKMPFDPLKDFTPIAFVVDADGVLVVHPSVPANSARELIALARSKPGALSYASGGAGTTGHLAGELFKSQTGTNLVHVPYKGNSPALVDLIAGQVQLSFATLQTALPYIRSGKLRPLAVLGRHRSPALPDVPTLAESALPGFEVRNWTGLLGGAGMPEAVTAKLNAEVNRIMRLPEVQAKMHAEGLSFTPMTPQEFDAFIRSESAKWRQVVKTAGVQAE